MTKLSNLFDLKSNKIQHISSALYTCTLAIALVVIYGWHTQNSLLIQILPNLAPMQYNTALCFGLLALAGIFLKRASKVSICLSLLGLLISFVTIIEYAGHIDLYIDTLLMEPHITVETSHPGRMAPNTALCFLLSSIALLAYKPSSKSYFSASLMLIAVILVAAISCVAFASYMFTIPSGYGWGSLTKMALHTTICFILLSTAIIPIALINYHSNCEGEDLSLTLSIAAFGIAFSLLFWAAIYSGYQHTVMSSIQTQSNLFKSASQREYKGFEYAILRLLDRIDNNGYATEQSLRSDVNSYINHIPDIVNITTVWKQGENKVQVSESSPIFSPSNQMASETCQQKSVQDISSTTGFGETIISSSANDHYICFSSGNSSASVLVGLNHFLSNSIHSFIPEHLQVNAYNRDQLIFARYDDAPMIDDVEPLSFKITLGTSILTISVSPTKNYIGKTYETVPFAIFISGLIMTLLLCLSTRYWELSTKRANALQKEARLRINIEESLKRKSQNLQMINDACAIAFDISNDNTDFDKILHMICETMKVPVGHIYMNDQKHSILKSHNTWFLYDRPRCEAFVHVTKEMTFEKGVGMPGRMWSSRKPVFIHDITKENHFQRSTVCKEIGLISAFGFPVFVNGELYAIFEFFSNNLIVEDHSLVDALEVIGLQIGRSLERLKSKEALATSEERTRQLLENAGGGILGIDTDGCITFFNRTGVQILGYTNRHELIGNDFSKDITHTNKTESIIIKSMKSRSKVINLEKVFFKADGSKLAVEVSSSPIIINDVVTGAVILFSDLTIKKENERKLIEYSEQLKRSNIELDDFAHITSHDLKEPLRGLNNYASFLLEDYKDKIDADGVKMLKSLKRLTTRMDDLLTSLLMYSRVGRVELAIKPCKLSDLVSEKVAMISHYLKESNAQVTFSDHLPVVLCDETKTGEVIYNLILNGIKYNLKAEKSIQVDCVDNQSEWIVSVKDNGIGIPEKHFETIFAMFKRLHGKEEFDGGSGSGLTISRRIVQRHGGRMWITSTLDVGSTFYFSIPKNNTDSVVDTLG